MILKNKIKIIILFFLLSFLSSCYTTTDIVSFPTYEGYVEQKKATKRIHKEKKKTKRIHNKQRRKINRLQNKSI